MFKVVASGTGYQESRARNADHGWMVLEGVKCPRCSHVFIPQPITEAPKCPECGFHEGGTHTSLLVKAPGAAL